MKKLTLALFLLLCVTAYRPLPDILSCESPLAQTRCADGMCSTSTEEGTCSSHGGAIGPVIRDNLQSPAPEPTIALHPSPEAMPDSGEVLSADNSLTIWLAVVVLVLLIFSAIKASYSTPAD